MNVTTKYSGPALAFESVTKIFRRQPGLLPWSRKKAPDTLALASMSLSVRTSEVMVLLGPNGSGKTTFLRLAAASLLPDSGRVLVAGLDTSKKSNMVHKIVAHGVALEHSFFPRLTASENLEFFAAFEEVPRSLRKQEIDRVVTAAGLTEFRDTLAMKLSSGNYQKLGIARALLKKPSLLLLDEPTRSLDPAAAERMWPLIREIRSSGTTVVLASHNFQEAASVADTVSILYEGHLVATRSIREDDSVAELRSHYLSLTDATGASEVEPRVGAY